MSTIHDDDATTWHDLADQLTPEQMARIEESERGYRAGALLPKPWWQRKTAERERNAASAASYTQSAGTKRHERCGYC